MFATCKFKFSSFLTW